MLRLRRCRPIESRYLTIPGQRLDDNKTTVLMYSRCTTLVLNSDRFRYAPGRNSPTVVLCSFDRVSLIMHKTTLSYRALRATERGMNARAPTTICWFSSELSEQSNFSTKHGSMRPQVSCVNASVLAKFRRLRTSTHSIFCSATRACC